MLIDGSRVRIVTPESSLEGVCGTVYNVNSWHPEPYCVMPDEWLGIPHIAGAGIYYRADELQEIIEQEEVHHAETR